MSDDILLWQKFTEIYFEYHQGVIYPAEDIKDLARKLYSSVSLETHWKLTHGVPKWEALDPETWEVLVEMDKNYAIVRVLYT